MNEFDLIVIGGGSGGFSAAMKANELGAKTLMINNKDVGLGGTCVNVGCLPTKHLLYAGELIHKAKNHGFKGLKTTVSIDFTTLMKEKDKLVNTFVTEKYANVLKAMDNVSFVQGNAKFVSKNEVKVGSKTFKSSRFVIATGSSTFFPPVEGLRNIKALTNVTALELKKLPASMIVLGGGPLALEFAQMFSRFGSKVTVLQRSSSIMKREEPELANLLHQYLEDEGIKIHTNVSMQKVEAKGKDKIITAEVNGKKRTFKAKEVLVATGRVANTKGMNLEKAGVKLGKRGEVLVSNKMQASKHVWAVGDVTGDPMLETVAAKEGMIAATNAFAKSPKEEKKMDFRVIPHATFTDPQLGSVGLTDEEVVNKGITCNCRTVPFELVSKARAINDIRGAIKLVVDNSNQRILGVHILGPGAADLVHEGVMIVKNKMTIDDVIDTVHIFPTLSESIKIAAQSFRRDIRKMSCCVE